MEESGGRGGPVKRIHAVGGGAGNNAWKPTAEEDDAHTQELISHILVLCVARPPQGRGLCGDMARQVINVLPKSENEKEHDADCASKKKRSVAKTGEKMEGQARVHLGAKKRAQNSLRR